MKRILAYTRGSTLNNLVERAAQVSTLNKQIQHHLPEECKDHVQVANYESGVLSLLVDSPSWSTRLHFETPRLLTAFRTEGLPGLASIKILLRPPGQNLVGKGPTLQPPTCSPATADIMQQLCSTIEHTELRSALNRLAQSLQDRKT